VLSPRRQSCIVCTRVNRWYSQCYDDRGRQSRTRVYIHTYIYFTVHRDHRVERAYTHRSSTSTINYNTHPIIIEIISLFISINYAFMRSINKISLTTMYRFKLYSPEAFEYRRLFTPAWLYLLQ